MANSGFELSDYFRSSGASSEADRIESCCSDHIIYRHRVSGKIVMLPNYCGSRWCPICGRAQRDRARATVEKIYKKFNRNQLRFVTLTQRDRGDEPLAVAMERFRISFGRLIRSKFWLNSVSGYFLRLETTYNNIGHHWHVHAHLIVLTPWLDRAGLKAKWEKITGDSFIVDVRPCDEYAKKELGKYLAKLRFKGYIPLAELVEAWKGKRSFDVAGEFRSALAEDKTTKPIGEWERIGSIQSFLCHIRVEKDLELAIAVCREIQRSPVLIRSVPKHFREIVFMFSVIH